MPEERGRRCPQCKAIMPGVDAGEYVTYCPVCGENIGEEYVKLHVLWVTVKVVGGILLGIIGFLIYMYYIM